MINEPESSLRNVLSVLQERIDNPNAHYQITNDLKSCYNDISSSIDNIEKLKKLYNDLAESHAKQVIEIGELQDINLSQKKQLLHYEINVLASKDAELEKLESELLKAKERFCQCNENDKTGSTSAMHCNHCGKIEQYETWLKDAL